MLSKQILDKTIREIKEITGCNCSIWNMEGEIVVYTGSGSRSDKQEIRRFIERSLLNGKGYYEVHDHCSTFVVYDDVDPVYVFVLENSNIASAELGGRLCVSQFEGLIRAYKERMDRNRFIQNLLLDNLLLVDIYNQAKKLSIPIEQRRVVIVIEPRNADDMIVQDTVRGIYTSGNGDYVTSVDEGHVILVKVLEATEGYKEVGHLAQMLEDTINTEAMVSVRVAYGTIVDELKDVSQSYKEAGMALNVGRIFYQGRNILAYNELGIGRLIYQLPISLCEMFLKEVFSGKALDQFDEETLSTVNKFFENNLNISETARQLYIHRNTLVYRLEKIQRQTGLDVRVFEDALTFKIALMVSDHINYIRNGK